MQLTLLNKWALCITLSVVGCISLSLFFNSFIESKIVSTVIAISSVVNIILALSFFLYWRDIKLKTARALHQKALRDIKSRAPQKNNTFFQLKPMEEDFTLGTLPFEPPEPIMPDPSAIQLRAEQKYNKSDITDWVDINIEFDEEMDEVDISQPILRIHENETKKEYSAVENAYRKALLKDDLKMKFAPVHHSVTKEASSHSHQLSVEDAFLKASSNSNNQAFAITKIKNQEETTLKRIMQICTLLK